MTAAKIKPTKKHAEKIIELLSHGLVRGVGKPEWGKMCVEAAVCFAFGLPHGDNPPCVGGFVRRFQIRLNDCAWSSETARAEGMKKLAIAQLGSDTLDQMEFGKACYLRGVQKLVPVVFRATAKVAGSDDAKKFVKLASKAVEVTRLEEAERFIKSAVNHIHPYTIASRDGGGYASAYSYLCGYSSESRYASAAAAYASTSAYTAASVADVSAVSTARSAASFFKKHLGDEFLIATAETALSVLIDMKSPGCKWLSLCKP